MHCVWAPPVPPLTQCGARGRILRAEGKGGGVGPGQGPAHAAPPVGASMSTSPDGLGGTHPGVSHHVTQDHTAIVQGCGEGLAGGDALSHLWCQREAGTCRHTQTHRCSEGG